MKQSLYVVTARRSRNIRDVTNGNVTKRSECAKHVSRRTVVKLTTAYFRLETDSWDCPFNSYPDPSLSIILYLLLGSMSILRNSHVAVSNLGFKTPWHGPLPLHPIYMTFLSPRPSKWMVAFILHGPVEYRARLKKKSGPAAGWVKKKKRGANGAYFFFNFQKWAIFSYQTTDWPQLRPPAGRCNYLHCMLDPWKRFLLRGISSLWSHGATRTGVGKKSVASN